MKLAPKILLLIAICTFVTMSITSLYVITSERKSILSRAYSEAKDINAGMISSIVSVMTLGIENPDLIHNYVENLRIEKENVLQVRLVHPPDIASILKDKDIAQRYRPRAEEHPRLEIDKRALAGEMIQQEVLFTRKGQDLRAVQNITPINASRKCLLCHSVEEGATLAALSTTVSLEPAFQAVQSRTKVLAAILAVGFLGTLILLYYALRILVVRPVAVISETARTIAREGNLSRRVKSRSGDEIGDLAASFNKMTEDLQRTTVSRDYMDDIIESMINSLIVITPEATIKTVNQATCDLLGYTEDELVGQPVKKIIAAGGIAGGGPWFNQVISGNPVRNIEKTYRSKDGKEIPVLFSASAMSDREGKLQGVVCAAQSTAKLKQTEEALQRIFELQTVQYKIAEATSAMKDIDALFHSIHEHLGTVIDTSNFYIALYDSEKDLLSFPYFVDEKDTQPDAKVPGRGLTEYVLRSGESLFVSKKEIYDLAERGEIELIGTPSELWLGVPLKVESKAVGVVAVQSYADAGLYTDGDLGVLEFVSGQIADALSHKQAEDALRESEERYRTILESIDEGYFEVDLAGNFTFLNDSMERISGYRKDELLGMSNRDYVSPQTAEEVLRIFNGIFRTGRPSRTMDYEITRKDGSTRTIEMSAALMRKPSGEPIGFRGVARDVTERKRAEEQLRKSEEKYRVLSEQLIEANNMKELLLDVITHDLKNPAGVISGMIEMMSTGSPEEEAVQLVKESSDSLLKVIENAVTLARVTMEEEIEKEELDLSEMIQKIVCEFGPAAKSAGMVVQNQLSKPVVVKANPIIAEVFKNYISNAIKYASNGKRIVIDGSEENSLVTVSVTDFGRTVAKKDRQRIFERTTQLGKELRRGRGLGLAIVKRIAEAHGGKVWVEPNRPRGNVFYLEIPK